MTFDFGFGRPSGLDRREWMRRFLQLAAGAAAAGPLASAAEWTPRVLTTDENRALIALGERIIPGSAAALCNRTIDLVLTQEEPALHAELATALNAFTPDADGTAFAAAAQAGAPRHAQFQVIKEWVADAYWSSEPGLRELGWTGKMMWSAFPGCETPANS